jgi:hypothetical protein
MVAQVALRSLLATLRLRQLALPRLWQNPLMCRALDADNATPILAGLLLDMRDVIAELYNVPSEQIRIGPVDFGEPEHREWAEHVAGRA